MMNVMRDHISSQNSHVGWLICEGLVEYQYHHHHHYDNFTPGVATSLLGGKHVKRTRYAYQLTLARRNTLRMQAYDEYCHDGY